MRVSVSGIMLALAGLVAFAGAAYAYYERNYYAVALGLYLGLVAWGADGIGSSNPKEH